MRGNRILVRLALFTLIILSFGGAISAQTPDKPFVLPVVAPPGPSTWLFGQPYGNTTGAYNFGDVWYSAGQGLHFGIDLPMPCGTPLVAIGDGDVVYVDNLAFGAGPHNLILRHPQYNLTTLYGHLLQPPPVQPGQPVNQGDIVGYSGDPDVTCDSRPHLHLEVRSLDYRTAYNPIDTIDANWHSMALVGSFGYPLFERDLENPRRWISLDDQPPVAFGGERLNNYVAAWPPPSNERPPASAMPLRDLGPLPSEASWQLRQLGFGGCCAGAWWHREDANRLFVMDGTPGQRAAIFEWAADTASMVSVVTEAPPGLLSPDGSHEMRSADGQINIRRLSDGAEWALQTQGAVPAISPDNSQLLWVVRQGDSVPGATPPPTTIFVSDLDGQNVRQILSERGAGAFWLDGARLMLDTGERQETILTVYDTRDGTSYVLGTWTRLRNLSVAPGGGRLLFYLAWQDDPAQDGVWTIETHPEAQAQHLSWFGGWRWRDANSVYYVPYNPGSAVQTLAYYDFATGENRLLTDSEALPLRIANGDWSVAPDGRRIVFQNANDMNTWLLEMAG